jgi:hypothetical protein
MNNLKKVIIWRLISVVITVAITYGWTGDLWATGGLTLALQTALLLAHWIFEDRWERARFEKIWKASNSAKYRKKWDHEKYWRPGDP